MEEDSKMLKVFVSGDSQIEFDISNFDNVKKSQIYQLKSEVKNAHAYSLFYYKKAGIWRKFYLFSGIFLVFLMGLSGVINVFFDNCSNIKGVQRYNVIFNFVVGSIIGSLSFINPGKREEHMENAGDEYRDLAKSTYKEAFLTNNNIQDTNFSGILDNFNTKFSCLSKLFPAPNMAQMNELLKKVDSDAIHFSANHH